MKTSGYVLALLLYMWSSVQDLKGQKRLDSIVRYAHTDVGNDSIAIAKRMFDYNGKGQLTADRKLRTTDYVHWENDLRTSYSYDAKGRLERISKDSFLTGTNTWKDYAYRTRGYSSDSDYVVRFYERNGKQFDTIKKYTRKSFFSDGDRKALVKYTYQASRWISSYDSAAKDYRKDAITKMFWKNGFGYYHYSGPKSRFFRLDSSSYHHESGSVSRSYKITSIKDRVIYVTKREKGEGYKGTYTSDSNVYFLNAQGLRDSVHFHNLYWQFPNNDGIVQKTFYQWTGSQLTGIRRYKYYKGEIVDFLEKTDFSTGGGALGKDTVFYRWDHGIDDMRIDFKKGTNIGINGYLRSTSFYKISPTVDSFQLHEKEIHFYSDPLTPTPEYQELSMRVFPNPSTGLVHIQGSPEAELVLYDVHGKELRKLVLSKTGSVFIKERGMFFLRNRHSGSTVKILIQ